MTVMSKVAGVFANLTLLLASCLTALVLGEAGLRLIHPKYEYLARETWSRGEDGFIRDSTHRRINRHPDTGVRHPVLLNSLGLRQHRDFTDADLKSSINIGFFGDSFTDNLELPAEFSFTEPLDYLLNVERVPVPPPSPPPPPPKIPQGRKTLPPINVLNFGHAGWGTAESMLRYERSTLRGRMDHVFYVYTRNDVDENVVWSGNVVLGQRYRRLWWFRLDDRGQLERVEAGRGDAFVWALLGKLHLTYLVLNVTSGRGRVGGAGGRGIGVWREPPPSMLAVFRQLLRRFKEAVEADGANFRIVWLPSGIQPAVASIAAEEGIESISLMDCFAERDPTHLRTPWARSPYRFKNNPHWNELGNRLAAMCLHRFLEGQLKLPRLSDEAVEGALNRYYSAFDVPPRDGLVDPGAAAIRAKYAALADGDASVLRAPYAPQAGQLVIRSSFDVYLHDGWLAYVKPRCGSADFDPIFFLHVVSEDVGDLPPDRQAHGFHNLDFGGYSATSCVVWAKLPGYAMARIRTGQYRGDGDGDHEVLWGGEHVLVPGRP